MTTIDTNTTVGDTWVDDDPIDILWIEDDRDFVNWVETMLGNRSPPLRITVDDGTDPLDVEQVSTDYDCVLVDYVLDEGDGLEYLKTLRADAPDLPIILLTGYGSEEVASVAIENGVTEYLPKSLVHERPDLVGDRIEQTVIEYRGKQQTAILHRIQRVTSEINRQLVHAETVDAIDQAICNVMSDADPYVFAWIGENDPATLEVTPRAFAGIESGYLESITITTDEEPTAQGPTGQALTTGELAVMQDIPNDPRYEPWREQALERGYRSSAAIPLIHQGEGYGVLNVYADRVKAFGDTERAILKQLGETTAEALHRVTVQQELRQFESAIEHADDAIIITDLSGTIEYVNPAFEALTGYTAGEIVGEEPRLLKSDEMSSEDYAAMWETIQNGETWHGEVRNTRNNGTEYVAAQTVSPITDEDDTIEGFVAIQRDMTQRRERKRQIEEQRNRLRVLFDGAPDGIVVHDGEGTIDDVNETLAEMLGYSRSELVEMSVPDFETGIPIDILKERWQSMETGPLEKIAVEGEHTRRDGSTYPVDVWISRIALEEEDRFVALVRDVSERNVREQRLELFERAVEEAGHAVLITDRDGDIEYVNPAFEAMSGYTSEEVRGRTPRILKSGKHADDFYHDLWETITDGDSWRAELQNRASDGSIFHVDGTISPVTDADGTITHFIGIESEITDRRLREQRLDVLMRILRHNLRNSMTIVLGRIDQLHESIEDPMNREIVESLHTEAENLVHLGEKVNTIRQIFEGTVADNCLELEACVADVISDITAEYPDVSITVQDGSLGTVKGDDRVKFGIREALENAVVHNDQAEPEITIETRTNVDGDHDICELMITDTGPGIPAEQREVIERGHETALMHTTGLGLWIIKWAAATAGGEIAFEANKPRGTSLIFRLPICED